MADVKWIKLSTDIFDNRKIRQIESMPNGDSIIVIWLKLLILAGDVNDGGLVYFTKDIPYTDQLLSTQFGRPIATVQLALQVFEQFGMIEIVDDVIMVSNWERYQNTDKLAEIREYNRIAKQKSRERRMLASNVNDKSRTSQGQVKESQDTDIDKETDKNKNKNVLIDEFETLWKIYPRKQGKKKALDAYLRSRKKGTSFEEVETGIKAYSAHIKRMKIESQYIKQGSTFFSQMAWQDDWSDGRPEAEEDAELDEIF